MKHDKVENRNIDHKDYIEVLEFVNVLISRIWKCISIFYLSTLFVVTSFFFTVYCLYGLLIGIMDDKQYRLRHDRFGKHAFVKREITQSLQEPIVSSLVDTEA